MLEQLLERQNSQNQIQKTNKYIKELESLKIHGFDQNITLNEDENPTKYGYDYKYDCERKHEYRYEYNQKSNNTTNINKNHIHFTPCQYQPSSQKEDVYHTLLALGLQQDNNILSDDKTISNAKEIIDILKQYNTLAYTIDTLIQTHSCYQIINTASESTRTHFDIIYSNAENGVIEPIKNSYDLQHAKYDIEYSLWQRMMETTYYTYNLSIMPFYNSLPKALKGTHHANSLILAWLLHHYGFDNIINKIIRNTHSFVYQIFGTMPRLRIYHKIIDGYSYPYFGFTHNRQPIKLDNCKVLNRDIYFDLSSLMGVSNVCTPPEDNCKNDDSDEDCGDDEGYNHGFLDDFDNDESSDYDDNDGFY